MPAHLTPEYNGDAAFLQQVLTETAPKNGITNMRGLVKQMANDPERLFPPNLLIQARAWVIYQTARDRFLAVLKPGVTKNFPLMFTLVGDQLPWNEVQTLVEDEIGFPVTGFIAGPSLAQSQYLPATRSLILTFALSVPLTFDPSHDPIDLNAENVRRFYATADRGDIYSVEFETKLADRKPELPGNLVWKPRSAAFISVPLSLRAGARKVNDLLNGSDARRFSGDRWGLVNALEPPLI